MPFSARRGCAATGLVRSEEPGRPMRSMPNRPPVNRNTMKEMPEMQSHSSHPRSAELYERACRVIPGGVNSPVRAFRAVGGHPLFVARGSGQFLVDADGREYLDLVGSWGPLILGHAHPA